MAVNLRLKQQWQTKEAASEKLTGSFHIYNRRCSL